jgi:omega-6 fatty acid desaturase (delta-12 desaturase)
MNDPEKTTSTPPGKPEGRATDWRKVVARYQGSHVGRSIFQLVTTLGLLVVTLVAMHRMLHVETWVTIVLIIPAAGFIIRTFIIMHDCSHGSFLPWPKVNDAVGFVTGVLTLTPYSQWRREHALHHASSGDLDRRGNGDVTTMTVREYLALGRWSKFRYRVFRNPAVLLGLGPLHMIVLQRFRSRSKATGSMQLWNVWMTNIAIAGLIATLILAAGAQSLLIIYLPAYYLATMAGVWLFYVQHQFEDAYWESHGTGTTRRRRFRGVRTCGCRACCSGLRGASGCTMCITWGRGFRTTGSSGHTTRTRFFTGRR